MSKFLIIVAFAGCVAAITSLMVRIEQLSEYADELEAKCERLQGGQVAIEVWRDLMEKTTKSCLNHFEHELHQIMGDKK